MRGDRDRILDMIEMCDLLLEHASDQRRLADDPLTQAAAQREILARSQRSALLNEVRAWTRAVHRVATKRLGSVVV